MRMPNTFVVIFTLAFTLTISGQPLISVVSNSKSKSRRVELPEGSEAANAIARLGELSSNGIRERLQQMRQPAYLPGSFLINTIVERQKLPVANNERTNQLKAALQPALDYHERSQMPIYVLWSEQPKAYLVDRAVIFITTRMMEIANEEEIRGIVAHELAHEYVWEETTKAMKEKDWKLRREFELFCDAVAAFTLKELGDDTESYPRVLLRQAIIGIKAGRTPHYESDTHPSLQVRKKLNQFLCQRLN